jgi:hypothetical protein
MMPAKVAMRTTVEPRRTRKERVRDWRRGERNDGKGL